MIDLHLRHEEAAMVPQVFLAYSLESIATTNSWLYSYAHIVFQQTCSHWVMMDKTPPFNHMFIEHVQWIYGFEVLLVLLSISVFEDLR